MTPIFKKGKKSDPANYRPVSLTNVTGKLMERVVKEALTKYLEDNALTAIIWFENNHMKLNTSKCHFLTNGSTEHLWVIKVAWFQPPPPF